MPSILDDHLNSQLDSYWHEVKQLPQMSGVVSESEWAPYDQLCENGLDLFNQIRDRLDEKNAEMSDAANDARLVSVQQGFLTWHDAGTLLLERIGYRTSDRAKWQEFVDNMHEAHLIAGLDKILRGEQDIKAGRTWTWDEAIRELSRRVQRRGA